jgi:hypothetical protein
MPEPCIDPNIPSVDNTTIECEDLISTKCIVTEYSDTYLRYGTGTSLSLVLKSISRAFRRIRTELTKFLPAYTTYVVVLSQEGTDIPVEEIIINNSRGLTPVYSRTADGEYKITSAGAFIVGKYVISPPNNRAQFSGTSESQLDKFYCERIDDDTLFLRSSTDGGTGSELTDGLLDGVNTILEIRFYT